MINGISLNERILESLASAHDRFSLESRGALGPSFSELFLVV